MPQFDIDTVLAWRGRTVRDRTGEKIGTVGDVFLDRKTDRPGWIGVRTGWFGSKETYVSLSEAREAGDEIHVGYDREVVRSAPQIEPDVALTAEEEDALHRHYDTARATGGGVGASGEVSASAAGTTATADGVEMIRYEEEVRLGPVERRPIERVRIRKVVVTEYVKQMVEIRKEVIQLEHLPPPPGVIESVEDLHEER